VVKVSPEVREKQEWLRKIHTFSPVLGDVFRDVYNKHRELLDVMNLYGENFAKSYAATIYIHPDAMDFHDTLAKKYFGKGFFDLYVDYIRDSFKRAGLGDFRKYVEVQYPVTPQEDHKTQLPGLNSEFVGIRFVPKSPRHFVYVVDATDKLVSKLMHTTAKESVVTSQDILNTTLSGHGLELRLDPERTPDDLISQLAYAALYVHKIPDWYAEWISKHRPADEDVVGLLHEYARRKIFENDSKFVQVLDFARKFPELQEFVHPRAMVELAKLYSDRGRRAYVRPVSGMKSVKAKDILDNLRARREVFANLGPVDFRKLANSLSLLDKGDAYLRALALLGHPHVTPEDLVHLLRNRDRERLADDLAVFLKHGSLDAVARNLSFSKSPLLSSGPKGNVSTFKAFSTVQGTPEAIAAERVMGVAGISPKDDPHAFLALVNAIKRGNLVSKINSLPEDVVRFELQRAGVTDLLSRFVKTKSPTDLLSILSRLKASRLGEYEKMLRHEVRDVSGASGAVSPARLSIDPFIELIDTHPALEQIRKGVSSLSDKKRAALLLYQKFGGDVNKAWSNHRALKRAAREIVQELGLAYNMNPRAKESAVPAADTSSSKQRIPHDMLTASIPLLKKIADALRAGNISVSYDPRNGSIVMDLRDLGHRGKALMRLADISSHIRYFNQLVPSDLQIPEFSAVTRDNYVVITNPREFASALDRIAEFATNHEDDLKYIAQIVRSKLKRS